MDLKLLRRVLVNFIRDEITKFGFKRCVFGLSGGVDSAVVAYLCAEALGTENTLPLILPYKTSSRESVEHAKLVCEELGLGYELVDITPMADAFKEALGVDDDLRFGNILARVRMIVLYDYSVREKALVVGTSNKTELLLGYGTLWGDLAHAINPLGDLYKTQVWELAEFLGVPDVIIEKKPSADLWPGQTDEEELGLSYEEADDILRGLIEDFLPLEELFSRFGREKVLRVYELLRKNQFKRKPPVIAKVGKVTIGHEFIAPRDWMGVE